MMMRQRQLPIAVLTGCFMVLGMLPASPARAQDELGAAIVAGDTARVSALLDADPGLLSRPGGRGLAPIHLAAQRGSLEVIELLLDSGADPNARTAKGWGPLDWAVNWKRPEAVALLIRRGADVTAADPDGFTALHTAARYGAAGCLPPLLAAGARLDAATKDGETPLGLAAYWGHHNVGAEFVARGMAHDVHTAAAMGDVAVLEALLAQDPARTGAVLWHDMTPLHWAARNGQADAANVLLAHGADVDARSDVGATPMHHAAAEDEVEMLKLLRAHWAELEPQAEQGTPLHYAASRSAPSAIDALVAMGADVDARNRAQDTPLHRAASFGRAAESARALIRNGAEVDAASRSDETPLLRALWHGHVPVAVMLLDSGADPEAAMEGGRRPLHRAAARGHVRLVQELLRVGADPNARGPGDRSPLDEASEQGHTRVVHVLIAGGADVKVPAPGGRTALHWAALMGHADIVDALLAAGADPGREAPEPVPEALPDLSELQWPVTLMPPYDGVAPGDVQRLSVQNAVTRLADQAGLRYDFTGSQQQGGSAVRRWVTPRIEDVPFNEAMTALLGPHALDYELIDGAVRLKPGIQAADLQRRETPLHCAARGGTEAIAQRLLAAGAQVDARDGNGKTPAMLAADNGYEALARLLTPAGPAGAEQEPAPGPRPPQDPKRATSLDKLITLSPPYPRRYLVPGTPDDLIDTAYAVNAVCAQIGLKYDFAESYANVGTMASGGARPDLRQVPARDALRQMLEPVGLGYRIRGNRLILVQGWQE